MNDDYPLLGTSIIWTLNLIVDDEKKSLAIMNLQAILNLDDMDIVIQLLEQNNWDESVRV